MVGKVGNADLCGGSAFTDYYSVIFIGFVNTGLAISLESLDHLKKDRVLKCFLDLKWICPEEFSFGGFVNFCACSTTSLYISLQNTFGQISRHTALRIKSVVPY